MHLDNPSLQEIAFTSNCNPPCIELFLKKEQFVDVSSQNMEFQQKINSFHQIYNDFTLLKGDILKYKENGTKDQFMNLNYTNLDNYYNYVSDFVNKKISENCLPCMIHQLGDIYSHQQEFNGSIKSYNITQSKP